MTTLRRLQRIVHEEPSPFASFAILLACVAAPTAARLALQPWLGQSVWFTTYYPALLFATLVLGWRLGLAALLSSALLADYLFIPPPLTLSVQKADVVAVLVYLLSGGIIVLTAALLRQALNRLNRAAETQNALNRELQHRVNNNMAVVQALAAQSIRSNPDPQQFYEAFRGRLMALSAAQTVLSSGDWGTCDFPDLPQAALQPFRMDGRLRMEGPRCSVPPQSCIPLVLALHELGTNATKYGALSMGGGQVLLRWRLQDTDTPADLVIEWVESGGPPVRAPSRKGLGSRLLAAQSGIKDVQTEYAAAGLRCRLVIAGASTLPGSGVSISAPFTVQACGI